MQERGRSCGGLHPGGGNDGGASPTIAPPAAAAGGRRSADPQADWRKPRGAAVWLGEIRAVERGFEPLPLADAHSDARRKYFDELGGGCCGVLVRNRPRRQGRAIAGEVAGRVGGRSRPNYDEAARCVACQRLSGNAGGGGGRGRD